MKKYGIYLIIVVVLLITSGCTKNETDTSYVYDKINSLAETFSSDYVAYQVITRAEDKHITLRSEGIIRCENNVYVHSYTHESLNRIGSGAASLITEKTGTVQGTADEALSQGFEIADGVRISALAFKDAFKTYNITQDGDGYVMTGYIARNTILRYTEGLDKDIRFFYKLKVNSEVTKIEMLEISYATKSFDSIVITLLYEEDAQ